MSVNKSAKKLKGDENNVGMGASVYLMSISVLHHSCSTILHLSALYLSTLCAV